MYLFKYIWPNVFLKMYLSNCICQNVFFCLSISLIKCLKGQKCLGLLFNVKNQKWLSDQWVSQWQGHILSCSGQLKTTSFQSTCIVCRAVTSLDLENMIITLKRLLLFFNLGARKSHFWAPENGHFQQKCRLMGTKKWDFERPNLKSETTFSR